VTEKESGIYSIRNVQKVYRKGSDDIVIFSDLTLDIAEGDFVAITGPSGSGKTTLLNLLGGIDQASRGTVEFRGKNLTGMSAAQLTAWRARHVGFIFQFYNLMPTLNAAQNVELPLLLTDLGPKARAAQVKAALELVQLQDRARHYPREMSGGQQQRVAIARAIVSDPDVLLCDEPTGDLDRETASSVMNILAWLNHELGKTVILVTHDPVAAAFAHTELNLDKGCLVQKVAVDA